MEQYGFVEKELPALVLAQVTERLRDTGEIPRRVGRMFERVAGWLAEADLPLGPPAVAWYESVGDEVVAGAGFTTGPQAATLEGVEVGILPAVDRAVTLVHRGPVEEIAVAWQGLHRHVAARGERPVGRCREVYHSSPPDRPEEWVTELQQPVAPLPD